MSIDNYNYETASAPKKNAKIEIWDVLSILMLILTLCIGVFYIGIFLFPQSALNPLQPNSVNPYAPPTPTITAIQLEPTWTMTPTVEASVTPTLVPTYTLEPSATPFSLITPTDTATPTATPKAPFSANTSYIASTIIHPDTACNWQGIYGTVLDVNNADILYMQVRSFGFYNGKKVEGFTVSGMLPILGKSGFELPLGTVPIASHGDVYIQLFDQAGLPLSDKIYIDTFNDCSKNLALVRFKKNP